MAKAAKSSVPTGGGGRVKAELAANPTRGSAVPALLNVKSRLLHRLDLSSTREHPGLGSCSFLSRFSPQPGQEPSSSSLPSGAAGSGNARTELLLPQGWARVSGSQESAGPRWRASSCYLLARGQSGEEKQRRICAAELCQELLRRPLSPSLLSTNPLGVTPSVVPQGPRVPFQHGKAAAPRIRNAGDVKAALLPSLQEEWECWGVEGRGMLVGRGVPQLCAGLSAPQPCVEHTDTSGS